jgi:hypothetical protein
MNWKPPGVDLRAGAGNMLGGTRMPETGFT